jgi:hypothetical protein
MCTLLLAQAMCSRQIEVCTKAFQGLLYITKASACETLYKIHWRIYIPGRNREAPGE